MQKANITICEPIYKLHHTTSHITPHSTTQHHTTCRAPHNTHNNEGFEDYVGEVVSRVSQVIIPAGKWICREVYGCGRVDYEYYGEEDLYIWRIPTVPDVEGCGFKYYVVAIKFLNGIDRETYEDEVKSVFEKHFDLRRIDSGSIFVISPKLRYSHVCRLRVFGGKAYLRWRDLVRGASIRVRAFPIVAKTVEKAVHRVLKFIYVFVFRRLWALVENVGIIPKLHDYSPMKLLGLMANGVITINKEIVRNFMIYLAKLSMHLNEHLKRLIQEVKLKKAILCDLELLGIPARKYYHEFRKVIEEIIRLSKKVSGPEPIARVLRKLRKEDPKDSYDYGLKMIEMLQKGDYKISS